MKPTFLLVLILAADAYIVLGDGKEITGALRIEGSRKEWTDPKSQ